VRCALSVDEWHTTWDGLALRIIVRSVSGLDLLDIFKSVNFAFCDFCLDVKFLLFLKIE
jgi:hypothetical protein